MLEGGGMTPHQQFLHDDAYLDRVADERAARELRDPEDVCGDCPPVGYPTDRTRCTPCPRRTAEPEHEEEKK